MTHSITKDVNPQHDSPLFSTLPPEVRNSIFELALTAYEDSTRKCKRNRFSYRPGFTCPHRIDTSLLLTCRRVYTETASLPASINEHVSWYWRGPLTMRKNELPMDDSPGSSLRRRELRRIHIFAQQFWLEDNSPQARGFGTFTGLWRFAHPTQLKITIRHTDWWWWEQDEPIALDPKQSGRPSAERYSRPSNSFHPESWGAQFRRISGLKCLQLELETVETKKWQLDAIVQRAKDWKFPLGDHHVLVLDESRTRRTGWIGESHSAFPSQDSHGNMYEDPPGDQTALQGNAHNDALASSSASEGSSQSDTLEAEPGTMVKATLTPRQRLEAIGVQFHEDELWKTAMKGFAPNATCTYYVVTLTWLAHRE
ncbi:MAG: hypothetical protein Q9207_008151 [Kuettlingeria erythrocarpa]